jgi:TATA-box binding protein (TBP) (component of TFIID and TFIIIB)
MTSLAPKKRPVSMLKKKKSITNVKKVKKVKILKIEEVPKIEEVKERPTSDTLKFPEFDDIKVSTKTFIVMTNLQLNIKNLFENLPITDYIVIPKRRGRKKKNEKIDPNNIQTGSIITLEYEDRLRGVDLKKKKEKNKNGKKDNFFRNSVTVVMMIDNKKVNFKASKNGKFQMTGCKYDDHAKKCIQFIWEYIKGNNTIYTLPEDKSLEVLFVPAMRNIDFGLGFLVDREKLDAYFNLYTEYNSLLETSFGYTGVNIKLPIVKPISSLTIKKIVYKDNDWDEETFVTYRQYLDMLNPKEQEKKLKQQRYTTFLVFHSGKVILSGLSYEFCKPVYYEFLDIIRACYDDIEERLDID